MDKRVVSGRTFAFSLLTLLVGIVYASLVFASCIRPGVLVNTIWHCVTYATLSFAVVASVYRSRQQRAFWIGVAVFGWLFFAMEQLPLSNTRRKISAAVEELIPKWAAFDSFLGKEAARIAESKIQSGRSDFPNTPTGQQIVPQWRLEIERLRAHVSDALCCAFLLLIAMMGGFVSKWLCLDQRARDSS